MTILLMSSIASESYRMALTQRSLIDDDSTNSITKERTTVFGLNHLRRHIARYSKPITQDVPPKKKLASFRCL